MRTNHLNKRQQEIFINNLKYPHNIIWMIGEANGIRVSDILNLHVWQIKKQQITIREIKTKKSKRIYIPTKAREIFLKYNPYSDNEKAFPITRQAVHKAFKKASRKSGFKINVSTHSMRKSYAWKLYNNNKDFSYIKNKLNHENLSDTLRYLI